MKIINNPDQNCDYLKDESSLKGHAEKIYFPTSTKEVEDILNQYYIKNTPITVQGALTGIVGGAVPLGGVVLNLSSMNKILNIAKEDKEYIITCQSGMTLKEINDFLFYKITDNKMNDSSKKNLELLQKDKPMFFPPDPTETLASIGGMVACDASGALSYKYGSVRPFIEGLKIVTPTKTLDIKRGQYKYKDINNLFNLNIEELPKWKSKQNELKDASNLYYNDQMDLLDLIIGSEGIFGIITEVSFKVIEEPKNIIGLLLFLNDKTKLIDFIDSLRNKDSFIYSDNLVAIEYFDSMSLRLIKDMRLQVKKLQKLPEIEKSYDGAIYLEYHSHNDCVLDLTLPNLLDSLRNYNISEEEQWYAYDKTDLEKLKIFRHSVPECVNILIANNQINNPEIHKIGTDMAVYDDYLETIISLYENDLTIESLPYVIFGHIGNNHLHVNIIPETIDDYHKGKKLLSKWANAINKLNGSISAEHGIGKLKKDLFTSISDSNDLIEMNRIKEIIDTKKLINKSTFLD